MVGFRVDGWYGTLAPGEEERAELAVFGRERAELAVFGRAVDGREGVEAPRKSKSVCSRKSASPG